MIRLSYSNEDIKDEEVAAGSWILRDRCAWKHLYVLALARPLATAFVLYIHPPQLEAFLEKSAVRFEAMMATSPEAAYSDLILSGCIAGRGGFTATPNTLVLVLMRPTCAPSRAQPKHELCCE